MSPIVLGDITQPYKNPHMYSVKGVFYSLTGRTKRTGLP